MSASPAGLPYAMHRTPVARSSDTCRLPLMNRFDQELEVLEWSRRQHPVAQVEDMARPPGGAPEHFAGAFADQVRRTQQDGGIQVPLDPAIVADPVPADVKGYAPVERDDVGAGRRDRLQKTRRVGAEMDKGNFERSERFEDRTGVGKDASLVVLDCQSADP